MNSAAREDAAIRIIRINLRKRNIVGSTPSWKSLKTRQSEYGRLIKESSMCMQRVRDFEKLALVGAQRIGERPRYNCATAPSGPCFQASCLTRRIQMEVATYA